MKGCVVAERRNPSRSISVSLTETLPFVNKLLGLKQRALYEEALYCRMLAAVKTVSGEAEKRAIYYVFRHIPEVVGCTKTAAKAAIRRTRTFFLQQFDSNLPPKVRVKKSDMF